MIGSSIYFQISQSLISYKPLKVISVYSFGIFSHDKSFVIIINLRVATQAIKMNKCNLLISQCIDQLQLPYDFIIVVLHIKFTCRYDNDNGSNEIAIYLRHNGFCN